SRRRTRARGGAGPDSRRGSMTRRAAALLLLGLALAVGALVLWTRGGPVLSQPRRPRLFLRVTPVTVPALDETIGAPPVAPVETVRLTLFFPGRDDGKLRPEERDIPRPNGAGAALKAIFTELQRGPARPDLVAPLPEKIQLRNAFLLPEGEVVLDLSVDSGLAFGSQEELTIVASIVDTVLQNVADTRSVRILVNGEPAESLGGHVDLTRPLLYLRGELAS
ncbi:MAG: GerMN domain-containing protein, partial [Thermoanaerobaculia bacterium]